MALVLMPGTGASGADETFTANLIDTNGNPAGRVTLTQLARGQMRVDVAIGIGREFAGFHGFHIHAKGTCDPSAVDASGNKSPFFTAGGHLNTTGATHNTHDGDLPPVLVNRDGTATMIVNSDHLNPTILRDADGSAVIMHVLPDNFANIPSRYAANGPDDATKATGDSGGRLLCGVVK